MTESPLTIVLDTGILIDLLEGKREALFNDIVNGLKLAYVTRISLTELHYILCRKLGKYEASEILRNLMESNFVMPIDTMELYSIAAELKCRFSIALGDCFSLALGKSSNSPVYMKHEKEIDKVAVELLKVTKIVLS